MLDFSFAWTMAAGGALVSSPIIIHLINRMRFKRVRWAAMEFLLKSQKRNRRKLIIEQIILLLLRILLVILIALILARWKNFGFAAAQNRHHIVILDDTPSMGDQWKGEAGKATTSFEAAKTLIVDEIAANIVKATKAQQLKVLLATDPDQKVFDRGLDEQGKAELERKLKVIQVSALHVPLLKSLQKARKLFEETPQDERILYIVSDYRRTDWTEANSKIKDELKSLAKLGIHVKFVDLADPVRKEGEKDPRYNPNLAITQFRPETQLVARNMQVEFTVTVANFSNTDRNNVQVKVKVNGTERAEYSLPIPVIRANDKVEEKFPIYLDRIGINQISANLQDEGGLAIDNARFAVVEVRAKIPILFVDGDPGVTIKRGSDGYVMSSYFDAKGVIPGYEMVRVTPADLEKLDLDRFASVYLGNVRQLTPKAQENLETYVKNGGSAAFFMGDLINPDFYNKQLWAEGKGIFPVPLADSPTRELKKEEREARLKQEQAQVLLRSATHPVLKKIYPLRNAFFKLSIDRHYQVLQGKWKKDASTQELITLPNRGTIDSFKPRTQQLLTQILAHPQAEKYRPGLEVHKTAIMKVLQENQALHHLAQALDTMLHDQGDARNKKERPNLVEFWNQQELRDLRREVEQLRETVRYGDPLVIAGRYGKGRTIAFLTSLGKKWNDWSGCSSAPVTWAFIIMMVDLQKYLGGSSADVNWTLGQTVPVRLDAGRYEQTMRPFFLPETKEKADEANAVPLEKESGKVVGEKLQFDFADAKKPGVYQLEFQPKGEASAKPEIRAYAFNVDTIHESNLQRAVRDRVISDVAKAEFYAPGAGNFTDLAKHQSDLSEMPWLYLIFLLVLIAEQALAVHLSFHLHQSQGTAAMPARAPV